MFDETIVRKFWLYMLECIVENSIQKLRYMMENCARMELDVS